MTDRPKARVLLDPVQFVALGFGSGLSPVAPGTMGTLVALVPAWLMGQLPLGASIAITAAALAAGVWICGESARRLGVHDAPAIVWDEITAMLALSLAIPQTPAAYAAAFVLFRAFDIVKPWPIRDLDHRMAGGAGIMLDDVVAALYAALILNVSLKVLPVA